MYSVQSEDLMVFKRLRQLIQRRPKTIVIKDAEKIEITDEIERSLWSLKEAYDFDTEEISTVVENYKGNMKKGRKS